MVYKVLTSAVAASVVFSFLTVCANSQMPTSITDALLVSDSTQYVGYGIGPTVEQLVESKQHYDPVKNTYVLAFHPREHKRLLGEGSDPLAVIASLALNSDAVVLGTPIKRKSALTSTHDFVFSDYVVQIDEVYSSNDLNIVKGASLVISRAGGEVLLGAARIRAVEMEFPMFHLNTQHLFFLHKLPSGSYLVGPSDAWVYEDGTLKAARKNPEFDVSKHSFVEVINKVLVTKSDVKGGAK